METINVKGKEYQVIKNDNGTISLIRYNEKSKMWIKLNFAKEQDPEIEKLLIKMLSDGYIRTMCEKLTKKDTIV